MRTSYCVYFRIKGQSTGTLEVPDFTYQQALKRARELSKYSDTESIIILQEVEHVKQPG